MITSEDVLDYLKDNPSFLSENEEILGEMLLPSLTGSSQFIERQIEVLKDRESRQKEKLDLIVSSARNNLKLEEDLLAIATRLLSEGHRGEAAEVASSLLKRQFDVREVVILSSDGDAGQLHPGFDEARQRVAHRSSICDDRVSSCLLESIFGNNAADIQSCAFVPLVHNQQIAGVMVLGSVSQDRFSPGMGVFFLDKLGLLMGSYLEGRRKA